MKTSFKVTTPQIATVHFLPYITRKANREMQKSLTLFPGVSISAAQKKLESVMQADDESEKLKRFGEITPKEQEAVFYVQEKMVTSIVDKIVLENETELDQNEFQLFFDRMNESDFAELGKIAGVIVKKDREKSEKKTSKSAKK